MSLGPSLLAVLALGAVQAEPATRVTHDAATPSTHDAATRPAETASTRPAETRGTGRPGRSIEDVAWLAGEWSETDPTSGRTSEELWLPPAGGVMFGVNRTLRANGEVVAFEHLRIEERDGELVYLASPGGRAPTEFRAVRASSGRLVFENAAHDFPQRVEYRSEAGGQRACFRVEDLSGQRGFGGCWKRR